MKLGKEMMPYSASLITKSAAALVAKENSTFLMDHK
jgi:hypothetical protein